MTTIWSFPTRILFGEGTVAETGAEATRLGASKVLIVSDKGVTDAGLLEEVGAALAQSKIPYDVFDSVSSNPTEREVLLGADAYRQAGADAIVAVGGGSPLDTGKLIRLLAHHDGPLARFDDAIGGDKYITERLPPMIALPTTAGTGSEVGRSGVVTIEETRRKTVIFSPRLIADVAILDPALTVSMPPFTTAATGFDALTHCIEAYCAKGVHPMADAIALAGIELIAGNLERAVQNGKTLDARAAMLEAAAMGAVAFQKGLGACHSLAHPLSAELGMHHGLANALCLPAVLDFNRGAIPNKIARIARILGVRGDDEETLTFECSGAIRAVRRKVGLPEGLAAAKVDEPLLPQLAGLAFADGCHQLNPRPCTVEDMLALYRASM
jgi:4-hydroxybutyrate dehydrogenase